jgi:hypothetical protein
MMIRQFLFIILQFRFAVNLVGAAALREALNIITVGYWTGGDRNFSFMKWVPSCQQRSTGRVHHRMQLVFYEWLPNELDGMHNTHD